MLLPIKDIIKAKERIDPYINKTPILTSTLLNQWLGHELFFKAECFQKIGAFKARGACNTVSWLIENHKKPSHLVANSSGNHAQAVAYAGKIFGIPSTIFMPASASQIKIQATRSYGANVVLCDSRTESDEKVEKAAEEKGTYWIPPYNHEQVIAGQGTAVYEALNELDEMNAVFAPCGGGGLVSGSLITTRTLAPKAEMIAAEPLNANDAAISLRRNKIYKLSSSPDTLADGAMTLAVGDITFEYLKMLDDIYEISEKDIIYWTQWLTHLLKVRVEPTSALAMAAAKQWLAKQKGKRKVLIVLSGGNIDHKMNQKIWQEDLMVDVPKMK